MRGKPSNESLDEYISKDNRTTIFMLPMIADSLSFKSTNFIGFVQLFLKNSDRPKETGKLYLLTKFMKERKYSMYEDYLCKSEIYHDSYEPDKYHTMFVFNPPKRFEKEYNLFLQGKYSLFSEEYKKMILEYYKADNYGIKYIKEVLYKEEAAFVRREKKINKDYPYLTGDTYCKIPRENEIGFWVLEESLLPYETYREELKVKGFQPNIDAEEMNY